MTPMCRNWSLLRIAALATGVALVSVTHAQSPTQGTTQSSGQSATPSAVQTAAPAPAAPTTPPPSASPQGAPAPSTPSASPPPSNYTASDGSASVMLPAGWKAVEGTQGLIVLDGPNAGEAAVLGKIFNAHNAPFVPGQKGADNTGMSMPYAASFADKVGMVVQQIVVSEGSPLPQGAVTSVAPIPVPRTLGQCGTFSGNMTGARGQFVLAGSFCALPLEASGDYKTMIMIVQLPVAESANLAAVTQSILASYNMPLNTLEYNLRPFDQPAGRVVLLDPTSSQCFELGVMHLTPAAQLPRACGGSAPN